MMIFLLITSRLKEEEVTIEELQQEEPIAAVEEVEVEIAIPEPVAEEPNQLWKK